MSGEPKICPFLTVGSLQIQNIVRMMSPQAPGSVQGQIQVSFAPCQEKKCALWCGHGTNGDGDCALKVLALETSSIADK